MENLYDRGLISYPHTESQKYSPKVNLKKIVTELEKSQGEIGALAKKIASEDQFSGPKCDEKQNHQPIHPLKVANRS
jgi:DNA topoisomerase IA